MNGVSQTRRDGTGMGMGRYGPRYRTAAGGQEGEGDVDLRQKYRDRNMGPGLSCRPDISVLNIVVETSSPFVALVVFCSVGRIGPSPPFFVFRPNASVALFWTAEVGGALTRRRYPFRLSPWIQISPTFNCTRRASREATCDSLLAHVCHSEVAAGVAAVDESVGQHGCGPAFAA